MLYIYKNKYRELVSQIRESPTSLMKSTIMRLSAAIVQSQAQRVSGRRKRKKIGIFLESRLENASNSEH